jgi:hypothetical protein
LRGNTGKIQHPTPVLDQYAADDGSLEGLRYTAIQSITSNSLYIGYVLKIGYTQRELYSESIDCLYLQASNGALHCQVLGCNRTFIKQYELEQVTSNMPWSSNDEEKS